MELQRAVLDRRREAGTGGLVSRPAVVNHVGLCVTDPDRAVRFYAGVFGFEVERELAADDGAAGPLLSIEPPVGLTATYLRAGPFVLEL